MAKLFRVWCHPVASRPTEPNFVARDELQAARFWGESVSHPFTSAEVIIENEHGVRGTYLVESVQTFWASKVGG